MANLTIVPADMRLQDVNPSYGECGTTIAAGDAIRTASGQLQLAQADSATNAEALGIALAPGQTGDTIPYAPLNNGGKIDLGAALTKGTTYVVSATAGKIAPQADLVSTNYLTILGVAEDTGFLALKGFATGVQL